MDAMPFPMHQNPGDLSRVGGANDFANGVGNTTNLNIDPALRYGAGSISVPAVGIGVAGNAECMDGEEDLESGVTGKGDAAVGRGNAAWQTAPRSTIILPMVKQSVILQSQGEVSVQGDGTQVSSKRVKGGMSAKKVPSKRPHDGMQTQGGSTQLPVKIPQDGAQKQVSLQVNQSGVQYGQVGGGNAMKRDHQAYMNDFQGTQHQFVPDVTQNEMLQNQGGFQTHSSSQGAPNVRQSGQIGSGNPKYDSEAYMDRIHEYQQQQMQPLHSTTKSWEEVMSKPDLNQAVLHVQSPQVHQAFGLENENTQRARIQEEHRRVQSEGQMLSQPPRLVEHDDFRRIQQMQTNPFTNHYQQNLQRHQSQQQSGSDVRSDYHTTMEPTRNPLLNQRQSIAAAKVQQQVGSNRTFYPQHNQQVLYSPPLRMETLKPDAQNPQQIQKYPQQNRPNTPVQQTQNPQSRHNTSPMILQPPTSFYQQHQGHPPPAVQFLRQEEITLVSNGNAAAAPRQVLGQRDVQQFNSAQNLANSRVPRPFTPVQTAILTSALQENQRPDAAFQENQPPQHMREHPKAAVAVKVDLPKNEQTRRAEVQKQEDLKRAQNNSPLQFTGNRGVQQQSARIPSLPRSSIQTDILQSYKQNAPVIPTGFLGFIQAQNSEIPLAPQQDSNSQTRSDAMFQIFQDPRMEGREFDHMRPRTPLSEAEKRQVWGDLEHAERKLFEAVEIRARLANQLVMGEKNRIGIVKGIKAQAKLEKKRPSHMMLDLMEHTERFDRGGYGYGIFPGLEDGEGVGDETDGEEGWVGGGGIGFGGAVDTRGVLVKTLEGGEEGGAMQQARRRGPGRPRVRAFTGFGGGR